MNTKYFNYKWSQAGEMQSNTTQMRRNAANLMKKFASLLFHAAGIDPANLLGGK